jgi:hypothetical protein
MGVLILADKVLHGEIPEHKIDSHRELEELIEFWLETKKDSVFVCFQEWSEVDSSKIYQRILVTNNKEDIVVDELSIIYNINIEDLDYSIFEFDTYEEAFYYCLDLKRGF